MVMTYPAWTIVVSASRWFFLETWIGKLSTLLFETATGIRCIWSMLQNNIFGSHPIRDVTRMMSLLIGLDLAKNLLNIWNAFQYKYSLSGLWYSNYKDKTVVRPSYLYNGDTYTVKTTFLFWNDPLLPQSFILFVAKSDFCWKIWIIPRCRLVGNHKRPLFRICGLLGCQRFWELRMIYVKEQLPCNGRCSFGKTASVNCTLP